MSPDTELPAAAQMHELVTHCPCDVCVQLRASLLLMLMNHPEMCRRVRETNRRVWSIHAYVRVAFWILVAAAAAAAALAYRAVQP